jgi:3',5'-cyclic AMP phosphodiesterase CpdA
MQMVTLAHLSDPHLGPLPPVAPADLMSKRILGYINWKRNRDYTHDNDVLDALLADIREADPDHIAVTGDLANLGLPAEFDNAAEWLRTLGPPSDVSVVPGNHDAYVKSSVAHFRGACRAFMTGDGPHGPIFPFVRRRGPMAVIGVSTAVASPPLMATGRVGEAQAESLAEVLSEAGREGLFRVVLLHHSPLPAPSHWDRRLVDAARVRAAIAKGGAELVLHGHNHKTSVAIFNADRGPIPVVGAAAASAKPGALRPGGSYNLYAIERPSGKWRVTMTERRINAAGRVETVQERSLSTSA